MRGRRSTVSTERPLILVADADPEAAWPLVEHFLREGYRAVYTARGEEALRLARAGRLGAAVVDIGLEDMDGHALVAHLKELDLELPIIMTAGDYRPELEFQARRLGILYYAHKPADCRLLEAVVATALARAGRDRGALQA
ncbi:MAG: response regulator [Candidatus Rokubacteria bacterium]|nr:response regulator [Candidatus Rokubacteria bacterium]